MRKSENEAIRWLKQAVIDLEWTGRIAEEGGYHIACFLSQQVAKNFKAFLYSCGEELVLGHSVARLSEWCAKYEAYFIEKSGIGLFRYFLFS